ncbi:MAG: hypothetical protein JO022_08165 [Acidobacteriaceae bacterium]|nr:hypothetical protein [Acidobacteriaceae bacterium]
MSKTVVLGILFMAVVLIVIIYSTLNLAKYRVEVCMTYRGQSQCRTAAGDSEEHALRSAASNACALIASGMTDSMSCEHSTPTKVTWLKR